MKGCVILIYFAVNTLFCDAVCILCITWIYTRNDFVSCALVVWNGTGICKVSCYQIASEVRVFETHFEVNVL